MARAEVDERRYVAELLNDLDDDIAQHGQAINGREIQTIFIGGGTPSLFSAESYLYLFNGLRERLAFSQNIEITLEANPGSSEREKFKGFREAGVNRLSIGVQSFNQDHLQALGRVHNSHHALSAAQFARDAGFDNFNLDLMFGLPDQSLQQSLEDVEQAIELAPSHLSCYQLTIEPNTLFHHRPPVTPDDEALWDMQEQLQAALAKHGYTQYEVSAYSQENLRCQHNLNYWQFGDYLAIGAGAHSKLSLEHGEVVRSWKIKHPNSYIDKKEKIGGQDTVATHQLPFEFMMNALRLNDGFELDIFEHRCGLKRSCIQALLDTHQAQGLISQDQTQVIPTQFGHNMLNNMLEDYLSLEL